LDWLTRLMQSPVQRGTVKFVLWSCQVFNVKVGATLDRGERKSAVADNRLMQV
jgi:hypothetical protein